MRFSKGHGATTRARILETAAALLRRDGVGGVSVPGLMREAGLTHGGFYAHFPSKDALVAEALETALAGMRDHFGTLALESENPVAAIIDEYVSVKHRDHPEAGCAMAAIGAEAARDSDEGGAAMATGARRTVERLTAALAAGDPDVVEDDVIEILTAMVGAVVVSRACRADPAFSDRILEVGRDRLKRRVSGGRRRSTDN